MGLAPDHVFNTVVIIVCWEVSNPTTSSKLLFHKPTNRHDMKCQVEFAPARSTPKESIAHVVMVMTTNCSMQAGTHGILRGSFQCRVLKTFIVSLDSVILIGFVPTFITVEIKTKLVEISSVVFKTLKIK